SRSFYSFPTRRSSDLVRGSAFGMNENVFAGVAALHGVRRSVYQADQSIRGIGADRVHVEPVQCAQLDVDAIYTNTPDRLVSLIRSEEHTSELQSPCNL